MASPCELLIETKDEHEAHATLGAVAACAWRIEDKFSRYLSGNVVHAINASCGRALEVDAETANLIDFAANLHRVSDGRFDITSGILRRAWKFDGSAHIPDGEQIRSLLNLVGWDKARWQRPTLQLKDGMEIDFGGIGKEYAVDQATRIASRISEVSSLVNFGGDLAVTRPRRADAAWRVGIEAVDSAGRVAAKMIDLHRGALATSGDTYRFKLKDGKRLSHILDPRTGWPVENAPRSVTVAADTCTQAGALATLALLHGTDAEPFLRAEGVQYWLQGANSG